ncbi:Extracellular metalloprotease [Penicillium diatomitis]|uniref:Extracellular metalloprotease n=1 Tax=Penicillium diatomitis TaxID=2819901 RepID=A0A9X0BNN4_9EURO|nr:Extracellular metalloprotease [Penicillium diatomitis]KAJ5476948.1 Extracellular metalloprotease [Penicillium diatomitis]
MVFHSSYLLVIVTAALFFLQGQCKPLDVQTRGICATEDPEPSFLNAVQRVHTNEVKNQGSPARDGPIEIDTWFHIVSSSAARDQVTDDMVDAQLAILQTAYQDAQISYRLQGVTRNVNDAWARNDDELGMKKALRKGTYSTLNVYFQTDLHATPSQVTRILSSKTHQHQQSPQKQQRGSSNSPSPSTSKKKDLAVSVLGFCTLPDPNINSTSPRSAYIKDGCNILAAAMSGGSLDQYNRGGTAIHEIGHWNGLLHTFQGETCDPNDPGDYISDTPQQSSPTSGCPASRDSCPDLPGADPIHDFMDYSSDVCYESFTAGQNERMRSMWGSMREGK